jgi:hypothetical protein
MKKRPKFDGRRLDRVVHAWRSCAYFPSFTVTESCCNEMNVPGNARHLYSPNLIHGLVTGRDPHN